MVIKNRIGNQGEISCISSDSLAGGDRVISNKGTATVEKEEDMSVSDYFSTFCDNLRMSDEITDAIQRRYHQIVKRINLDYYIPSMDFMLVHMEEELKYGQATLT